MQACTLAGTRQRDVKFTCHLEVSAWVLLVISFSLLPSVLRKVQPEFVDRHQTDYIAAEGERVELDCSVRPNIYPSASVVWQKREGGLLKEVYKGETHTIQKAGLEHSGTYLCKATNNPHKPLTTRLKHVVLNVYGKRLFIYYNNVVIIMM